MIRPPAIVISAPGTNRDGEAAFALERAGADVSIVALAELAAQPQRLQQARLVAIAGASALNIVIKVALYRTRPGELLYSGWSAFSFPSGHSTINVVLYGFLAFLIALLLPAKVFETGVTDGKLYAIRYGDELRVKYLSRRLDGILILRSVNPIYKDEEVSPELASEHITVIGRVRDASGPGGL